MSCCMSKYSTFIASFISWAVRPDQVSTQSHQKLWLKYAHLNNTSERMERSARARNISLKNPELSQFENTIIQEVQL